MNGTSKEADGTESLKNQVKKKRGRSSHSKKSLASGKTKNSKDLEPLNQKSRHKTSKGTLQPKDNRLKNQLLTAGYGEADSTANTIQEKLIGLCIDNISHCQNQDSATCGIKTNCFEQRGDIVIESVRELQNLLNHCIGNLGDKFFIYGVTALKLIACNLTTLPPELGRLVSLEVINVSQNKLEELPESIGQLQRLYSLQAEFNCLSSLPQSIKELKLLSFLVVNDNLLKSLPDGVSDLEKLDTFDVSSNLLRSLPAVFKSAETISRIYMQKNLLKTMPSWLVRSRSLQELHAGENQISAWLDFKTFGKVATKLQMLDLCENKLSMLADSFDGLTELSCLNLGRNPFDNQKKPWAIGNFLISLPNSFCQLSKVTLLSLDGNQLKRLPNNFGDLINLRMINLVHNSLETLPDSFCQLQSLELCLLSRNCLQRLPENFGNLPFLNHLEVNDNKLRELPPTFKNLVKLTCLDLSNNRLMKEPNFLHVFTHLNYLNLHSNPFEYSFVDIVDPELSYAYNVEDAGESPKSGQFEDLESDEVGELNLESKTPSNNQEGKEATVQIDPPANNLSQSEHHNATKGNQISQSSCQQKQEEEEEAEETDCDWELSHGLYDVDTYSYQDRHFFMPSDIHCKNVRYNSVQFHFFPGQFDDADD